MTPEQLQILQHSLGVDQYGRGQQSRNHFCAGGKDKEICEGLVALGFMFRYRDVEWVPYPTFGVSDDGRRAMVLESPAPPKLTRSQIRYREYLKADTGFSFREWLGMQSKKQES